MSLMNPGFGIVVWSFVVYVLFLIFFIVIGKFVYGWYAEIKKRNRLLAAQVKLLAAMAEKQGVDVGYINEAINIVNTKNAPNGDIVGHI